MIGLNALLSLFVSMKCLNGLTIYQKVWLTGEQLSIILTTEEEFQ
jgi:hypothetical protein